MESRIEGGAERLGRLAASMTNRQIAELFSVSERTVARALQRIKQDRERRISLAPMAHFHDMPEVQRFIQFQQAKGVNHGVSLSYLRRAWQWIREEPAFADKTERPAVWNLDHVRFVLARVEGLGVLKYPWIQAFRHFFKSQGGEQASLVDDLILRASIRHARGGRFRRDRPRDYFTRHEFERMLSLCDLEERVALSVHVSLGCREGVDGRGGLMGLAWERLRWRDGLPVAWDVYETKTGGGTLWEDCPLDLFNPRLPEMLKALWELRGRPSRGGVWSFQYRHYAWLFRKFRTHGIDAYPHDCRRSHATWLREMGVRPEAIMGAYNARTGRALAVCGVGWENANVFLQRYGRMGPAAIERIREEVRSATSPIAVSLQQ